jgi:hypothetical protein
MQAIEETGDQFERSLARNLRRQVDEWKTRRSPARTHLAGGVLVERRGGLRRSPERVRLKRA